jgi:hypothetical protein
MMVNLHLRAMNVHCNITDADMLNMVKESIATL